MIGDPQQQQQPQSYSWQHMDKSTQDFDTANKDICAATKLYNVQYKPRQPAIPPSYCEPPSNEVKATVPFLEQLSQVMANMKLHMANIQFQYLTANL